MIQHSNTTRIPLLDVDQNITSSTSSSQVLSKTAANTTPSITTTVLDLEAAYLVSSPYSSPSNQLQLSSLSLQSRLFAFALTALRAIRSDYATAPYLSSFNWNQVFGLLRTLCIESGHVWKKAEFYVVIFRSKLQESADRERLGLLDEMSHREACESGGLLKYWFGTTDADRRNLATCVWACREDAAKGGSGPWHKKARESAREMYESITFHTHRLVVEAGAESWRLEDY